MMGFKATNNKDPLGLVPDLLVVGPSLETAAKRILVSSLVVQDGVAVDNIHKDECAVQVNPYISGSQWFLMCTGRGIKPVSVQKRKEGSLQRWDQDSDTCVKDKNENHYGVHYRGESVATSPFLVIGGNLS
jgi:phage major head subunit gpT-like protein